MKNVIKAVKKLKLWSKKKRKKKKSHHGHEHEAEYPPPMPPPPPPPLPCHRHCCSCSSSSTTQPSAPPLPSFSWLEAEHNYGTFASLPPPEVGYPSQQAQDIAAAAAAATQSSSSPVYPTPSYQQYMVPVSEPVAAAYGIPVQSQTSRRRERSTAQFGFVFSFGAYLFRCFCPCLHIREKH